MGGTRLVFIDANIFLELMFDDEKADNCEDYLRKIKDEYIRAKTSDFVLYSCLLQIRQKLKSTEQMKKFLFLLNELNFEIIRPSLKEVYNALNFSEKYKLDFDDSLIVSCMISNNIKTLISFDKHFDKINLIGREEP
ncbi:type II toxin-antitoxin system VapC family toxin [Candidatus Woesearchaeota archaeon]|nr:type II toxin-antitoxin system VapC family toxin [Candidatus Woesearchaeota archaeon]